MSKRPQRTQRTAISKVDFFHDDWLSGTSELSIEQRGVYITFCALYWSKGGRVPENDHWLAGMCSISVRKWRKIKDELVALGKIEIIDGFLYQERAEIELENAVKIKDSKRENGAKGGCKSAEIRANAMKRLNTGSSEASSEPEPPDQALRACTAPTPAPTPLDAATNAAASSAPELENLVSEEEAEPDTVAEVFERVCEMVGWQPAAIEGQRRYVSAWLAAGAVPDADIYPTVREIMGRRGDMPPESVTYFWPAIKEAKDKRLNPDKGLVPRDGKATAAPFRKYDTWTDDEKAECAATIDTHGEARAIRMFRYTHGQVNQLRADGWLKSNDSERKETA